MWNIDERRDAKTQRSKSSCAFSLRLCVSAFISLFPCVADLHISCASPSISDDRQRTNAPRNILRSLQPRLDPPRLGVAKLFGVLSPHARLAVRLAAQHAHDRAAHDVAESSLQRD